MIIELKQPDGLLLARLTCEVDLDGYLGAPIDGGNIYIHIDNEEWGSLFFHAKDGQPSITLGQYDINEDDWVARNPLLSAIPTFSPTPKEGP